MGDTACAPAVPEGRPPRHGWPLVASLLACFVLVGCGATPCHVVYDAGSSGTRLFVYAQDADGWTAHAGPKVGALADPVREIRGRTWSDADAVAREVVDALEQMRRDGPSVDGAPAWTGFDWQQQCDLRSARVLATAGMRVAEQENRARAAELWARVTEQLRAAVGPEVVVDARTITGFEEGLYAWLALRADQPDRSYGIAEMGGASAQITFECPDCDPKNDAVRSVVVDGAPTRIYSYSYLGLGQDEALRALTGSADVPADCRWNVGADRPDWSPSLCRAAFDLRDGAEGVRDPYNVAAGVRGIHQAPPIAPTTPRRWTLTGAFNHWRPDEIDTCCRAGGACYQQPRSCFVAVYRGAFVEAFGVPADAPRADVNWTAGANLCHVGGCLEGVETPPACRWSPEGCL